MSTARRIWSILLPRQRRAALLLFVIVLVATAIETLSIGLVVPALAFMTHGASAPSPRMTRWLEWLGNPSPNHLTLMVLVALLGIYTAKSLFLLFEEYCTSRFVSAVQARTSRRLFATYLAQPWTFHLQRQSASLMRTIGEAQEFATICGVYLMTVSESLVLAGLVTLLLWFEPTGAIVVAGVLAAAVWVFQVAAKPYALRWADEQRHHAKLVIKHVQQGIGGAKDVKIRGVEGEFLQQFWHHAQEKARLAALQAMVGRLPRLWFELLAVAALLLLTAVLVWQGTPPERVLPMLGLFTMVAFRLLPSVNHLTNWVNKLHSSAPMLESLAKELSLADEAAVGRQASPLPFRDQIVLDDICYRYPGSKEDVLHSVSIRIPHGASVGFVGGSGAGKTTLIDVILGLLPPTSGTVRVDGRDIHDDLRGWQDLIGYVSQTIYLCDDSIRKNVAFGVPDDAIDDEAVRRALQAAQLDDFVAKLPHGVDTFVGERGARLSGGQRQRIGIARALYHGPQVLVLDEATSALDTETEKGVMAAVNALHGTKTVIIVAHRLTTVAECDTLYRLEKGQIVRSGTYAEVVAS